MKPRPRPRVVIKKAVTACPNPDITASSFSHISDPPISVTGRTNDSIHPATATSFVFSSVVVDDEYSSFDIAERAKMRSRKSQAAKKSMQPPAQMSDVIELTSDEDELALKPTKRQKKQGSPVSNTKAQAKARPKPRLKVKPAALPSDSPLSPAVIRDLPAPPARCDSSSQLPASTLPTIPPSTPPQAREPTPLSSPLVTSRKRRRVRPPIAEDDDEMDITGGNPAEVSLPTAPPPFFAPPSSSVPTDSGIKIPPVEILSSRGKKKQASSGKKGIQKKAQGKGRKGKKGEVASIVDEIVEDPATVTQVPCNSATHHSPNSTKEHHSPAAKDSTASEKTSGKQTVRRGKARAIDSYEEDEPVFPSKPNTDHTPPIDEGEGQKSKVHW